MFFECRHFVLLLKVFGPTASQYVLPLNNSCHICIERICTQLFKTQAEYYDIPTQDLSIHQIREKLALLAANILPPHSIATFKDLLAFKGASNAGNAVTDDLKYTSTSSPANLGNLYISTLSSDFICHSKIFSPKRDSCFTIRPLGWSLPERN